MNIAPFIEGSPPLFRVGGRYEDGDCGPVAEVSYDGNWLHIVTDSFEGHAMLNIEVLPLLIEALQQLNEARNPA